MHGHKSFNQCRTTMQPWQQKFSKRSTGKVQSVTVDHCKQDLLRNTTSLPNLGATAAKGSYISPPWPRKEWTPSSGRLSTHTVSPWSDAVKPSVRYSSNVYSCCDVNHTFSFDDDSFEFNTLTQPDFFKISDLSC